MTSIAFVGTAHIHTPGFANMLKERTDVRVTHVWDHLAVRGQYWAEKLGATFVPDAAAIYANEDVTAVVVCSETNRHRPIVEATAAAGKHLFVEKPLSASRDDAYAMADAIEKAGVLFQTGYFQRGDGKIQFLKEQVEKGAFGQITRVRGSNCHSGALGGWFDAKPNDPANDWLWMTDMAQSGVGAFGDLGTHSLDILIWLFGEIESVTAQLDKGTNRYGCDEAGEALIRFKNGIIGTLAASWDDTKDPLTYLITGTEGHAAIVNGQLFFSSKHRPGSDSGTAIAAGDLPPTLPHAFVRFLDAVAGASPASGLVLPHEAAYRSSVMAAMYQSARTQTTTRP